MPKLWQTALKLRSSDLTFNIKAIFSSIGNTFFQGIVRPLCVTYQPGLFCYQSPRIIPSISLSSRGERRGEELLKAANTRRYRQDTPSSRPQLPVQRTILNGLGDVITGN